MPKLESTSTKAGGPRTTAGKQRSSRNATSHGIFASEAVIRAGEGQEDAAAFDEFLSRLAEELEPSGELQRLLVERLAVTAWRLRRLIRYEVGAIRARADEAVHNWTASQIWASEAAESDRELAPFLKQPAPPRFAATTDLQGADLERRLRSEERARLLASLPDADTLAKVQRYEAHLSREFNRTLSQLYEAKVIAG